MAVQPHLILFITPVLFLLWCQNISCEKSFLLHFVFLDFLRSSGEPSQHHGLAGLAEVLQHSSLRPRSKSKYTEGFEGKNFSLSVFIVLERGTYTLNWYGQQICLIHYLTCSGCDQKDQYIYTVYKSPV